MPNKKYLFQKDLVKESEIFFLTGLPKSGTTWLMNILNSSEEICCLGEGRFFSSDLQNVPSLFDALYEGIRPWHEFIALRKKNWIGLDDYITTINYQNFLPSKVTNDSLNKTVDVILHLTLLDVISRAKIKYPRARLVGDKTPVTRPYQLQRIIRVFPSTKVIFLYRNVKDFIVSILFHYWRSIRNNRPDSQIKYLTLDDFLQVENFVNAHDKDDVQFVSENTGLKLAEIWKELREEALSIKQDFPNNFFLVSYEKLFEQPVTIARRIFSFLGLNVSLNQVTEFIEKNSINSIKQSKNSFLMSHVRNGQVGDWKNYLSEDMSRHIDEYIA